MKLINFVYLAVIIISFAGMAILDKWFSLAWFADRGATIKVVLASFLVFFCWDLAGINLKIFYLGSAAYKTGWQILPNFPIEEVGFLLFLPYLTLVVWRFIELRTTS